MTSIDDLARKVAQLERRLDARNTAQLSNSSIIDGAVSSYDDLETLRLTVGKQFDDTYISAPLVGPTPPVPTAPKLVPSPGGLIVTWDGYFAGTAGVADPAIVAPMDFLRIEVHAAPVAGSFNSDTAATLFTTFETPRGGSMTIRLPNVPHSVLFRTRSATGKLSDPSAFTNAQPGLLTGDMVAQNATIQRLILSSTQDVTTAAGNQPPLRIGDIAGNHLRVDGNEIMSMLSTSGRGGLGIQGTFFTAWDWGFGTRTPDSSGDVVINHNLGMVPGPILVTPSVGNTRAPASYARTATSFTIRFRNGDGTATTVATEFSWLAIA